MPIRLDIATQLDRRAAENAAQQAKDVFDNAGREAGKGFDTNVAQAITSSSTAVNVLTQNMQRAKNETRGVGDSVKVVKDEFSALQALGHGVFEGIAISAGNLKDTLGTTKGAGLAGAILGIGAVVGIATRELYQLGAEWDTITDRIAVRTGKLGSDLDALKSQVGHVATGTAAPLAEIGDIFGRVAQSMHLDGQPLEQMTKTIADLQEMTGEGIDIRELARSFRVFGVDAKKDGVSTLNSLASASRATGIPITNLVDSMNRAGPTVKQFNLDYGQTASLLMSLEEAGVDQGASITALTFALKKFSQDGKEPREELAKTISEIQRLSSVGDDAGAGALASKTFGRGFAPLFEAVKSGKVDVDSLNESLKNTGPTIDELREGTSDWQEEWQKLANLFKTGLEPAAASFFGFINQGLETMISYTAQKIGELKFAWQDLFGNPPIPNTGPAPSADMLAPGAGLQGGWWNRSLGGPASGINTGNPMADLIGGLPGGGPGGTAGFGGNSLPGLLSPNAFAGLPGTAQSGAMGQPGKVSWQALDQLAASLGVTKGSTFRAGSTNLAGRSDYHSSNHATDYNGSPQALRAFAEAVSQMYGPQLSELIFDQKGWAGNVHNGQNTGAFGNVYTMNQAGYHGDHVHVALAQLARQAQGFDSGGSVGAGLGRIQRQVAPYPGGRTGEIYRKTMESLDQELMLSEIEYLQGQRYAMMNQPMMMKRSSGGPGGGGIPGFGGGDKHPALLEGGEHVFTKDEVAALGGHAAVYRLRNALRFSQHGVARMNTGGAMPFNFESIAKGGAGGGPAPGGGGFGGGAAPANNGDMGQAMANAFLGGMQNGGGYGGLIAGLIQSGIQNAQGGGGGGAPQAPAGRAPTAVGGTGTGHGGAPFGAAMGAASALDLVAPGAGTGAQVLMQLGKRAAEFGGQAAAIGIQGFGETFLPNGSALGDPSRNWLGRIAGGISGVRPANPTTAGKQEVPMQSDQGAAAAGGTQHGMGGSPGPGNFGGSPLIGEMHVTSPSKSQEIARDIDRQIASHGAGMGH